MLALALSGGGARGIAHLGVLAALDTLELPIGRMAGVSSGAIAGTFYAAGFAPAEILRMLTSVNIARLTRLALSRYGLLHLTAVEQLFISHLGVNANFADLRIPLTLVTTDLTEGVSVEFSEGPLIPPLLASAAVPIVYRPVEYQGRQLVDGGLLNNLPVSAVEGREMPVVGINCNPSNRAARITTFRSLIERVLHLAISTNTMASKQRCDLLLEPEELRTYRTLQYRQAQTLFNIGYRHTMDKAKELAALLG
ncbi:hypothetical protein F1C16_08265 [Hymenobacter sp. NBH84]|uniref:patatin-like phospholipase family protein n=1 Tax=Hymenobacter sp. NBH84 TaxID=2596915 RepID=UPI0016279BF6|nr:patatin-like phospholipase family protein [Hymenobacter sp. NBH84]QNE39547.1 hypothetical protein F1C16_08265 [Hymenobacter sp. NBH84]